MRYLKILISVICLFPLCVIAASKAKPHTQGITIGFISGANPETFEAQGAAFAKALQDELKTPVNIYISKDYDSLARAMQENKIQFAFFSPSVFVQVENEIPAKVLLKKVWKEPFYYSAIIVPEKSKIKKLGDLKGRKVAFVDKNSASGYLYPKVALSKASIKDTDFKELIFSGNHENSMQLLVDNKVDAVAVFSDDETGKASAWSMFAKNNDSKFRIIWLSEPIPNDAFCVHKAFYDKNTKLVHDVMFGIIDLYESERSFESFSELLGSKSLVPATSKHYDAVREMNKILK